VIKAGFYAAIAFGRHITVEQLAALMAFEPLTWLLMRGSVVAPGTLHDAGLTKAG
jgi:hypothetical protein